MRKLKYNPFSATSILWVAILAMACMHEGKDFELIQDEKAKDPKDPLKNWDAEKYHMKFGDKSQPSPQLIHAVFNTEWKKEHNDDVAFGFICYYMELDKKKILEIQERYLCENDSMDVLIAKGRVLKTHPMHKFWEDAEQRLALLGTKQDVAPEGDVAPEATKESTKKTGSSNKDKKK